SRALSVFYLGMPLGGCAAFLLPVLLKDHLSWREMFFLAGGPGFVVALLVALLPEPPRGSGETGHQGKARFAEYLQLLKTPTLLLVILAQAFAMMLLANLLHFGKDYIANAEYGRGLGDREATLVMLGVLMAGMMGNLLSGLIGDKLSKKNTGAY